MLRTENSQDCPSCGSAGTFCGNENIYDGYHNSPCFISCFKVPIAGIGFAFLGIEQLSYSIAAPIVGYNAIMWVYLGWYSKVRVGWGNWRIPEACMVILVGVVLGWATGLNQGQAVKDAAALVTWWGPVW